MRLRLVVNPAAGGVRRDRVAAARARLAEGPWALELCQSRSSEHLRDLAAEAASRDDCAGLVVAGGDGTVSAAVAGLLGSRLPLGVLPLGTGNDFASALGLPGDPVAAAAVILTGRTRAVDLGRARPDAGAPRPFACAVGIGLDEPALRYSGSVPWLPPRLRYAYGGVRALIEHRPRRVRVEIDGVAWDEWTVTIVVTNTPSYGAGMRINPLARVDDGRLDLCAVARAGRIRLLRLFPTIYRGTHVREPEVRSCQGRVIRVEADQPIRLCVDGDPTDLTTPVVLEAQPGALSVFAPG
ncbi:MAG TPA: diacylglycerol kinase family protein [Chloroflexota bacterium]